MKFSHPILLMVISILGIALPNAYANDNDILTGDTALACEAVLCLSSGQRPEECNPSLSRYFNISHKKWKDTVNARRNFLQLCPASQDTSQNMPALVEDIVEGAGRCNADYLNRTQVRRVEKTICPWEHSGRTWGHSGRNRDDGCYTKYVTVIINSKPSYCSAYANNTNTYQLGVSYIGEPMQGGHWIDDISAIGQ